jgi:hypothetical protein
MRYILSAKLEAGRFRSGRNASASKELFGAFEIQGPCGARLLIISGGTGAAADGWEHVSVSIKRRPPNWQEMCFVKDLFWDDEEEVIQFHPPKSEYVNFHPNCLHLWRPIYFRVPLPPSILVGPKQGIGA